MQAQKIVGLVAGFLLVVGSGCFKQPEIDVGSLSCETEENCPIGYVCDALQCRLRSSASANPATPSTDALASSDLNSVVAADAAVSIETATDSPATGGSVGGSGGATGSGGKTETDGTSSGGSSSSGGTGSGGVSGGSTTSSGGMGSGGVGNGGSTASGGSASIHDLTASTLSVSLGDVVIGETSSEGKFTVTNTGQQTSGVLTVTSSGPAFVIRSGADGDCISGTTALATGTSCSVRVAFTPSEGGADSALITIAETAGNSAKVSVSGNGLKPAFLEVLLANGGQLRGRSGRLVEHTNCHPIEHRPTNHGPDHRQDRRRPFGNSARSERRLQRPESVASCEMHDTGHIHAGCGCRQSHVHHLQRLPRW